MRIRLSHCGLPALFLTVPPHIAPQGGFRLSSHDKHCLGHSVPSSLRSSWKSPWVMRACSIYDGVQIPDCQCGGPAQSDDWTVSCFRLEVPATLVLQSPMHGDLSITINLLSAVHLHALTVFTDASGSLQSEDVSAPMVRQVSKIEWFRPLANYWAATSARNLTISTTYHLAWLLLVRLLQPLFCCAQKDGGLRPILDLRHLNSLLRVSKCKILRLKSI